MSANPKRLPAELTLAEASAILGRHRSNVYRKFKARLRWGSHNRRRVLLVPMRAVLEAIAGEKSGDIALPEVDDLRQRIAALTKVMERYAEWAAKVAKRQGIPV